MVLAVFPQNNSFHCPSSEALFWSFLLLHLLSRTAFIDLGTICFWNVFAEFLNLAFFCHLSFFRFVPNRNSNGYFILLKFYTLNWLRFFGYILFFLTFTQLNFEKIQKKFQKDLKKIAFLSFLKHLSCLPFLANKPVSRLVLELMSIFIVSYFAFRVKAWRVLAMITFFWYLFVSLFDCYSFSTFDLLTFWLGLFNWSTVQLQ